MDHLRQSLKEASKPRLKICAKNFAPTLQSLERLSLAVWSRLLLMDWKGKAFFQLLKKFLLAGGKTCLAAIMMSQCLSLLKARKK